VVRRGGGKGGEKSPYSREVIGKKGTWAQDEGKGEKDRNKSPKSLGGGGREGKKGLSGKREKKKKKRIGEERRKVEGPFHGKWEAVEILEKRKKTLSVPLDTPVGGKEKGRILKIKTLGEHRT